MKAIILAAGKVEWLDGPITEATVDGVRLLDLQVHCLRVNHINEISVVGGHQSENLARHNVSVIHNDKWAHQGSVGSLRLAFSSLNDGDDVVVLYGDIAYTPDVVSELISAHGDIAAVCFVDQRPTEIARFREFAFIEDGYIRSVGGPQATSGLRSVFAGMIRIRAKRLSVFKRLLNDRNLSDADHLGHLVRVLTEHGFEIVPVMIERGWAEVQNREDLQQISKSTTFASVAGPLRTDWSSRAVRYNNLNWANDDKLLEAMVRRAMGAHPAKILDIGTGTGKILTGLREALVGGGEIEFWGVDSSAAMLARIPRSYNFRLFEDQAEDLSKVPDGYFDLVTARMVFHHILDTATAGRRAYQKLRPGGMFILCEGVPPSQRCIEWYTHMFRFKEDRHTLPEGDLINIMIQAGFSGITTDTVIMRNASLKNWLDNSGIPQKNIDILKALHYDAPKSIQDDYQMEFRDNDCFMTWRFAVVTGTKPV